MWRRSFTRNTIKQEGISVEEVEDQSPAFPIEQVWQLGRRVVGGQDQGKREGTNVGGREDAELRGPQVNNFGQVHCGLMESPSEQTGVIENITFLNFVAGRWCDGIRCKTIYY